MIAEYKIPGGKLIATEVSADGARISYVKITGDFFMHPEESIVALEGVLKGIRIAELEDVVDRFFDRNQVNLIGLSKKDIVKVIKMALEQRTQG